MLLARKSLLLCLVQSVIDSSQNIEKYIVTRCAVGE